MLSYFSLSNPSPLNRRRGVRLVILIGLASTSLLTSSVAANAAAMSAACQKVNVRMINADKIYIALQYGVVKAAQNYVADSSLSNRLLYNDSYIKAIQAINTELNFAITAPKCYPADNVAKYAVTVKTNLTEITNIQNANINGQVVGDPKKMTKYKPVGLLK